MGSGAICFAARDANAFCAGAQWLATGATGGVIEGSGLLQCVKRLEPMGQILNTSFGSRNESSPSTRGTKSHPTAQALMAAPIELGARFAANDPFDAQHLPSFSLVWARHKMISDGAWGCQSRSLGPVLN